MLDLAVESLLPGSALGTALVQVCAGAQVGEVQIWVQLEALDSLNEGLCQQKGNIGDVYVTVRGLGAGDTPMVDVYQDQAIGFLEGRAQCKSLSLHGLFKTYERVCIPETVSSHPAQYTHLHRRAGRWEFWPWEYVALLPLLTWQTPTIHAFPGVHSALSITLTLPIPNFTHPLTETARIQGSLAVSSSLWPVEPSTLLWVSEFDYSEDAM